MPESLTLISHLAHIESFLQKDYPFSKRFLALLLLQEDGEAGQMLDKNEPEAFVEVKRYIEGLSQQLPHPLEYEIAVHYRRRARSLASYAIRRLEQPESFSQKLDRLMREPLTGVPILLVILYLVLYQFVGVFGAGVVVGWIEVKLFEGILNPFLVQLAERTHLWKPVSDLLVGEYGMLTLGVRYAVALILPIVTFFFIAFSIIEDSGYLPRLAMLLDRVFKKVGLSGRAVIPMVLGFGCDTMATVVTRTLPTQRERLIATFLLTLTIPCSAQLGVILALLSGKPLAMTLWIFVISAVFMSMGYLSARILPGLKPSFFMELPPLRWPHFSNVITKTYFRVKWYFYEILPLFLLISILIWFGQWTGIFEKLVRALVLPTQWLGLPRETAAIFLFGFFRRDYGAAGLYDLNKQGLLTDHQILVAVVALTLFLPCVAQFLINIKERGLKTGLVISIFILFFSFFVAYLTHLGLTVTGLLS